MELVIAIGLAVVALIWILACLLREPENIPRPSQDSTPARSTVTFKVYDPEQYKEEDEAREAWLKQHYPDGDKHIFTKVVGVSRRNNDGSSRREIIWKCRAPEELMLVPEPNNPFDANAIAVCRVTGEQLGYLRQRLAGDMHRWMEEGQLWIAVLIQVIGKDPRRVGAILTLVRMNPASDRPSCK